MVNKSDLPNLIGGTLVEYLAGAGFSKEWGRVQILEVQIQGHEVRILTNGPAHLMTADFDEVTLTKVENILYLRPLPYLNFCYALAPKGVNIPTPEERGLSWNPFRSG
jgi:hypothetical protein